MCSYVEAMRTSRLAVEGKKKGMSKEDRDEILFLVSSFTHTLSATMSASSKVPAKMLHNIAPSRRADLDDFLHVSGSDLVISTTTTLGFSRWNQVGLQTRSQPKSYHLETFFMPHHPILLQAHDSRLLCTASIDDHDAVLTRGPTSTNLSVSAPRT